MPLVIEEKQLVTPGDLLAEGDYRAGENTYRDGDRIYASEIGLANSDGRTVYVVALRGGYMPIVGDLVIGKVVDVGLSGWTVDINAPYTAVLFASEAFGRQFSPRKDELTRMFDVGDLVLANVVAFDRTRGPVLTIRERGLGKITHGRVIKMTPTKIPRLIGRKGSMISLVKRATGCQITVGQNGLILVRGREPESEALAILAIHTVEKEAHTSGLTDRISELVKEKKVKKNG